MVEELATRPAPGVRVDIKQVGAVGARIEQFTHGAHIWDRHMAHFGIGDGGDELCGEQSIALDALVDDETAGNQPQPGRHREDDGQTDPAYQRSRLNGLRGVANSLPASTSIVSERGAMSMADSTTGHLQKVIAHSWGNHRVSLAASAEGYCFLLFFCECACQVENPDAGALPQGKLQRLITHHPCNLRYSRSTLGT